MSGGSPATPPPPCTPTCCSEARSPYSFVDFAPTRSWTAWANLLALGVVTNYGAYLAYGRSLQSINQVKAAIIGNIEPVLATFWVWLFWNENFSAYGWAGSALVISAVFLLTADRS
ncbi:MAG: EamA family transporter [Bilophila wadsworthia]